MSRLIVPPLTPSPVSLSLTAMLARAAVPGSAVICVLMPVRSQGRNE